MVEHNLAKVGVAGPSPVFRSFFRTRETYPFMNLYLRYFDQETLVTSVDDAIGFLKSIPEIEMDAEQPRITMAMPSIFLSLLTHLPVSSLAE